MIWAKVSELCIQSGQWRIYRYPLATPERFELWHVDRFIGGFASGDEAKRVAAIQGRKAA